MALLEKRFPNSPRVALLLGMRFEAQGDVEKAKKVYDELLAKDETNVVRLYPALSFTVKVCLSHHCLGSAMLISIRVAVC